MTQILTKEMIRRHCMEGWKSADVRCSTCSALLYILTYEGVYRHEILGVYSSKDKAFSAAERLILVEDDGYHDIEVGVCRVNTDINDIELVATFKRTEKYMYKKEERLPKTFDRVDV
jgi:hypothetical protein